MIIESVTIHMIENNLAFELLIINYFEIINFQEFARNEKNFNVTDPHNNMTII